MNMGKFVIPKKTALLVIDMQYDYCAQNGKLPTFFKFSTKSIRKMIPKLSNFIEQARESNVTIIWTRMIEDQKSAPTNLKLKMRSRTKTVPGFCVKGTKGFDYYSIHPNKKDKEIVKNQYDAFTNNSLGVYLKNKGIANLIFTGVYTSRCVDSTLRSASARGYNCIVPKDLVGVAEEMQNEHDAALSVWDAIFAYVVSSKNIVDVWKR